MELERYGQPEGGNGYFKRALSGGVEQRIGAFHHPHRRLQNGATGIAKALPRANQRLLADDAFAAHFLTVTATLSDFPVARHQLNAMGALVMNSHGVAKHIARLNIVRLVGTVARRDVNFNG